MIKLLSILLLTVFAQESTEVSRFRDLYSKDYLKLYTTKENKVYYWHYPNEMIDDDNLGYRHTSNKIVTQVARTKNEIVFDAQYSFDQYGRRINLVRPRESQKKFLILSGCSFVYGNGLNDEDTLNNIINNVSNEYYAYNYGIGGTGTNSVLALIEENKFKDQIELQDGVFVYVYLKAHIFRSNGTLPSLSWLRHTPYYEKNDSNDLERKGNFVTGRKVETKFLLYLKDLIKYLPINQSRIFPPIWSEEVNYTCELVKKARSEFKSQYPSSRFYVYIHGFHNGPKAFRNCLESHKINIIDGQISQSENYVIKYDGHPSGMANKVVAQEILQGIETKED